jgi:hypothetical protein
MMVAGKNSAAKSPRDPAVDVVVVTTTMMATRMTLTYLIHVTVVPVVVVPVQFVVAGTDHSMMITPEAE